MTPQGSRWARVREAVTGALWPLPTVAIVLAVGLGVGLPVLDDVLDAGQRPLVLVFEGGPSAARGILSTIAGSIISVTTLLFSLTIVTLQLASSQYSPRLLQTFVRDRVVQVCLGVLLATFVYALVVLRSVRSADESEDSSFVPRISVTVALLFTLASVAALVTFLAHQTRQLRVETMMRDVHTEATATLDRLTAQLDDEPDGPLPAVPAHARLLCARASGFLVQTDERPLLEALSGRGAVLRLDRRPGESVVAGTPLAWVWTDDPAAEPPVDDLEAALAQHVVLSYERSPAADPSYGLRKLVDIAARALSPGINDPTTAVHALSHVSTLVGQLSSRGTWHRRVAGDDGVPRLLLPSWDHGALLDLAVTQVRSYGRQDPTVVERLFSLLAEAGWRARSEQQRQAVREHCAALTAQSLGEVPAGRTEDDVRRMAAAVERALEHRWEPLET
ncbi:DUF2254 domain-containing protein [Geodermatophilus sp. DSM 44513]|uniref:DUF2254 domain-containing protein n=1 Tax=Geodermatophilus sp. DSM 44513 TaxID=1528104 RepID=UPI0012824AF9|nr:DUF2254 domain-containing protein [Geodermatophilus sp. DSM 44513]WNV74240.1 DUF2254 domain-containing protein [Geodermatophilus sp. DSM 44513]